MLQDDVEEPAVGLRGVFHPLDEFEASAGPGHRGGEPFGGLVQLGFLQVLEDVLPEGDEGGVA
ncbi:hypothetical protein Airi01_045180 [Actinoallomurus iriomotensis]|uniref:Uncharacterized protein n=1 Tax=Actinoallomurus iriomotensis TaxID=478107 RepID=A0A9W6VS44_9ACTN|nr:hypothetical protein Airi01_045180 [Actinoallomurus iriomotensis]